MSIDGETYFIKISLLFHMFNVTAIKILAEHFWKQKIDSKIYLEKEKSSILKKEQSIWGKGLTFPTVRHITGP